VTGRLVRAFGRRSLGVFGRFDFILPQQPLAGLIRHLDAEIDITGCRPCHADDASADPFDPYRRGVRGKLIPPY
jgi:hypothetical protein